MVLGLTPAIGTGIVSSLVLVVLLYALYKSKLRGGARAVFAVTATLSLYLNLFVLVVQSFLKVPALHALAPLGKEPPFAAAQAVVRVASIALGYFSVKAAPSGEEVAHAMVLAIEQLTPEQNGKFYSLSGKEVPW